jgi:chemotaxis-related protein WspD
VEDRRDKPGGSRGEGRGLPPPSSSERRGLSPPSSGRLLVVQRGAERWVFPVDGVDQVRRVPRRELGPAPATVSRAVAHLARGVFPRDGRSVGLLDDARLFEALRTRLR